MRIQQYLAGQLAKPTGMIGKFVLGRVWNKRNAELNDVTLTRLALQEDDRVLDMGIGGGYLLNRIIPNVQRGLAAGIDVSPVIVDNCRARWQEAISIGNVDIRVGTAEALPYPDRYFTKVSSVNSLFYWDSVSQGIAEIYRVLRDHGKVVLTYTCPGDLANKWFIQYVGKLYDAQEIRRLLATIGFREIHTIREQDRHREFLCTTGEK